MKKNIIMIALLTLCVSYSTAKPHYANVDEYPVKQGSLEEMALHTGP